MEQEKSQKWPATGRGRLAQLCRSYEAFFIPLNKEIRVTRSKRCESSERTYNTVMKEDERHDYSLLGSFMPKETAEPRKSIPVELDVGDSPPSSPAQNPVSKKSPETSQ